VAGAPYFNAYVPDTRVPHSARKIVAEHLQKGKVVDGLTVGKKKEPEQAK
jgi:(2Fe-2S) ferredoxin